MADANWSQVKEILDAAIRRRPEERAAFLEEACAGNEIVRREVDSLLSSFGRAGGFMDEPVEHSTVALNAFSEGKMVGRYEILSLLGKGGMGEVYLARDPRLRRNVAIKALPERIAGDPARLSRFEQEAIAASALNHPNILTIHEVGEAEGTSFIVSEYVAGMTLRDRIPTITVSDSIEVAAQVASALKAAHENGIVHRDIKPENIMMREDGLVKVLDFGLAKLSESVALADDTEAATLAQIATQPGTIMGTVTYMSPEQARGLKTDRRTDVWSLGAVLHEMISGAPPFQGSTPMDTIAAILEKDPGPLPAGASQNGTAEVVTQALRKDLHQRYQSAGEMLDDLRALQRRREVLLPALNAGTRRTEILEAQVTNDDSRSTSPRFLRFGLLVLIILAGVGGVVYYMISRPSSPTTQALVRSPAYDLYMRGRVKARSDKQDEIDGAIKVLEEAVALDPNFAESYAPLAVAYTTKAFQFAPATEQKQISENAEIAVEKALALDPNSAEVQFARGVVLWTHRKRFPHEQTIRAYKKALAIDPNHDEAHHRLAMVLSHIGLLDEAQRELGTALELNPNNTMARFRVAVLEYYQGKYADAVATLKSVPEEISPKLVNRLMAEALLQQGRMDESGRIVDQYLEKYPEDQGGNVTSVKAMLLAKAGKYELAKEAIDRSVEIGRGYGHFHHTALNIARAYAIMQNPDEAIRWLQDAADDGFPIYSFFEIDPYLAGLRRDPRFIDFLEKGKIQMERYRNIVQSL